MARRVGFGDQRDESDEAARAARTYSDDGAGSPLTPPPRNEEPAPPLSRLIAGAFLMLWLVLWAAGVLFAIGMIPELWREGEVVGAGFLTLFVGIAGFGWWIGIRVFLKIIRGEPVRIRNRPRGPGSQPYLRSEPDDHGGDE